MEDEHLDDAGFYDGPEGETGSSLPRPREVPPLPRVVCVPPGYVRPARPLTQEEIRARLAAAGIALPGSQQP